MMAFDIKAIECRQVFGGQQKNLYKKSDRFLSNILSSILINFTSFLFSYSYRLIMSSSEDSDFDLQFKRIIKPKKLIPRFNPVLFNPFNQSESSKKSLKSLPYEQKNKPKRIMTNPCFEDSSVNSAKKLHKQFPNDDSQKIQPKKKIRFDVDSEKDSSQTHQNSSNFKIRQSSSLTNSIKIKFMAGSSERQVQETDFLKSLIEKSQSSSKKFTTARTCKGTFGPVGKHIGRSERHAQLKQKTTPIFGSDWKGSQLVKQYIKNGSKIRTHWIRNLMNGYTEIDYLDKGKFRGIFKEGDLISGQMTFPNKFVYTGQFQSFMFHGFGKLKFPSGQVFEGNWDDGYLEGKGKITYPKGQIYCGQISNFRRQGEGYLYFTNGDKYVGQFTHGQITGFGQLYKNGNLTFKGFWSNGKFFGEDYDQFQEEKQMLAQEDRLKRSMKKFSKQSSLRESMKKISEIHESINQEASSQNLVSEVKVVDLSMCDSSKILNVNSQKNSKGNDWGKKVSSSINFH